MFDTIEEKREYIRTINDTMRELLIEKGIWEGKLAALRAILLRLLRKRFKRVPRYVQNRINAKNDVEQLNDWLNNFATATTLDDVDIEPN